MNIMTKFAIVLTGVLVVGGATATKLALQSDAEAQSVKSGRDVAKSPPSYVPKILTEPSGVDVSTERRAFEEAARSAWALVDAGYVDKTGFVVAQPTWPYPTIWDIGSALAAYYSAHGLGLITDAEYQRRTLRALETLKNARLYDGAAYGRNYDARTGDLLSNDEKPSETGHGYSAIDLGRLLVWLKIVAQDSPELAKAAELVARRVKADRIIQGGYLYGEAIPKGGKLRRFQEGRIGYEQYAAAGFELWGMKANNAARASTNARKVMVQGLPMTADRRKLDRILSEPFIMHGLELGLQGDMKEIAWQTLALQAQRYNTTGSMTMASEDAINIKPYYFYYYCVYCSGKEFVIQIHRPGLNLDEPRWISAKAAYAWHALMPSKYTWAAINSVQAAHQSGKGWATGVFEKTGKSTEVPSLNTAAVILEAALYQKTGKPFLNS